MATEETRECDAEPDANFLDIHSLYRGVHKDLWRFFTRDVNAIGPNFFITPKDDTEGLSVDWSKYATPQFTLNRLREPSLSVNGIVSLNLKKLRDCFAERTLGLTVKHDPVIDPDSPNRAHTLIRGINQRNKTKVKFHLSKMAEWAPGMQPVVKPPE
jgi:hypothetical protein